MDIKSGVLETLPTVLRNKNVHYHHFLNSWFRRRIIISTSSPFRFIGSIANSLGLPIKCKNIGGFPVAIRSNIASLLGPSYSLPNVSTVVGIMTRIYVDSFRGSISFQHSHLLG